MIKKFSKAYAWGLELTAWFSIHPTVQWLRNWNEFLNLFLKELQFDQNLGLLGRR